MSRIALEDIFQRRARILDPRKVANAVLSGRERLADTPLPVVPFLLCGETRLKQPGRNDDADRRA
jgi:hypothetical protein